MSLAGFLLPFLFCLNPALLGKGTPVEIGLAVVTALIGSYGLATGVQRYFKGNLSWIQTAVVLLGSVGMLMPGAVSDVIGVVLIALVYATQIAKERKRTAAVS